MAMGYSDAEYEALLAEVGQGVAAGVEDAGAQVDRAEELREKWQTCAGQLWLLDSGKGYDHRLICGDCTDPAVVARVMGGERAALMLTDPPYMGALRWKSFSDKCGTESAHRKVKGQYRPPIRLRSRRISEISFKGILREQSGIYVLV